MLVVSQPNTVTHNQTVYVRLAELGWDVHLIVPARWVDEYSPKGYAPVAVDGFTGRFSRVRVAVAGEVQRHFYITRPTRWLRRIRPDAVFLEQEPFAITTFQWGQACDRLGIPWGIQGDENLDRPFPWPAKVLRWWSLPRARFFAARSPAAGAMLRRWGARNRIDVVPHTIPEWSLPPRPQPADGSFTVGFAGRLIEAKGIRDLLAAMRLLDEPARLLMVGDGELRGEVEAADLGRSTLELRTGLRTDAMIEAYREMDVLVLPSRTTETWAEQFGKVLCEALLCGVPVIGSSSGEIPWVIETAGGGWTFPEGDAAALAALLTSVRADPDERARRGAAGRDGTERAFAPRVAAAVLDEQLRDAIAREARR